MTESVGGRRVAGIKVLSGKSKGLVVRLGERLVLGRSPLAHVPLDDERCSRFHCHLLRHNDQFAVLDTSTNGTWLNTARLERGREAVLVDGDKIRFGTTEVEFRVGAAPSARLAQARTLAAEPTLDETLQDGQDALSRHDYGTAEELFTTALGLAAKNKQALEGRAKARAKQGNRMGAIEDYDLLLADDPSHTHSLFYRGLCHAQMGDTGAAVTDLTEVIRRTPRDADAYLARGDARREHGDLQESIHDYTKAIQLQPHYAPALRSRGLAYSLRGDHERAIKDYDEAIRLQPHYALAFRSRARSRRKLGQMDDAALDEAKATELSRHWRGDGPRQSLP